MDEKKKTEGEEREQLGPYQLEEQMPQEDLSKGELYRATHEKSGATALVFKPAAGEDVEGLTDCRVRFTSSSEQSYIAVEVEDSQGAPDRSSVEALVLMFEGVRKGVRRMARAFDDDHESRRRWRLGLALASAAVVGVLLLALVRLSAVSPLASVSEPLANTPPEPMSHEVPMEGLEPDPSTHEGLVDTSDAGESVVARPLPSGPFKGQKRPPCTRYTEVELVGACWLPHKLKAPCPESLYEYQGECYVPAYSAKPPPQSVEP